MEGKDVQKVVAWGVMPGFVEGFGLSCEGFSREEDAFLWMHQRYFLIVE